MHEKTNNLGSDKVRHKSVCAATEEGKMLKISDLGRRGIVLSCGKNKGADQICVFVFAYANCWFSHAKARILFDMLFFDICQASVFLIYPWVSLLEAVY